MFIIEDLKTQKDIKDKRLLLFLAFGHIVHVSFSQVISFHLLKLYVVF